MLFSMIFRKVECEHMLTVKININFKNKQKRYSKINKHNV